MIAGSLFVTKRCFSLRPAYLLVRLSYRSLAVGGRRLSPLALAQKHPLGQLPVAAETLKRSARSDKRGEAPATEIQEELRRLGFGDLGIGEYTHIECPSCKGGENFDKELALRITSESIAWKCFRGKCGWQGTFDLTDRRRKAYTRPNPKFESLSREWLDFFKERLISNTTLQRNQVQQVAGKRGSAPVSAFPYLRNGALVNVKYRTTDKRFWQEKDAEKILYGWDDIIGQDCVIIVEGEIDKLSLEEAGYQNVASVPDGAPAKFREHGPPPPKDDKKFSYLWDSQPAIAEATRIILATDNDEPGRVLAEELAIRLGPEKCHLVTWSVPQHLKQDPLNSALRALHEPSAATQPPPKDANDVLRAGGPAAVKACLEAAIPFPVPGLISVPSLAKELLQELEYGAPKIFGLATGWANLDALYKVRPACLTVVAGPLLSGKTEFVMELLCRLSSRHSDFKSGLCLLEPQQNLRGRLRRLLELHTGRSFPAGNPQRLGEARASLDWISDHFAFISTGAEERRRDSAMDEGGLEEVLELVRIAHTRNELAGLLIDSFQVLTGSSSGPIMAIQRLRAFAQQYRLHVWLIEHTLHPVDSTHLLHLSDVGLVVSSSDKVTSVRVLANKPAYSIPGVARFTRRPGSGQFLPC